MDQRAFPKAVIVLTTIAVLRLSSSFAADPHGLSLEEGRSAAEICEYGVEVCGMMSGDRLREFPDRCAAQAAGADRVLEGPCFDADWYFQARFVDSALTKTDIDVMQGFRAQMRRAAASVRAAWEAIPFAIQHLTVVALQLAPSHPAGLEQVYASVGIMKQPCQVISPTKRVA